MIFGNFKESISNWFNPFVPNVSFFYPLKKRVEKGYIGNKWVNLHPMSNTVFDFLSIINFLCLMFTGSFSCALCSAKVSAAHLKEKLIPYSKCLK